MATYARDWGSRKATVPPGRSRLLEQALLFVDEPGQLTAADGVASHRQAGLARVPGEKDVAHPFPGRKRMRTGVFPARSASETQTHE